MKILNETLMEIIGFAFVGALMYGAYSTLTMDQYGFALWNFSVGMLLLKATWNTKL
jgi:hypothetical protein